jgi:uncharacterized YigZ family protein
MTTSDFKYRTIQSISEGFYKEKGSKFYAFAHPCETEEEAKKIIASYRKAHFQAVHVCSAFRFGSDKKRFRASDDGEPSNSAGPPILGQIQSFDLTNILIAVVRYYGGTNLGVGGLIHAYKTAAKDALEQAIIIEQEDEDELIARFSYDHLPAVMPITKQSPCTFVKQDFQMDCELLLRVPVSNTQIWAQLTELNTQSAIGPIIQLFKNGIEQY